MESFIRCFRELDRKKVAGVDGIIKEEYRQNLKRNTANLIERMKTMSYRAKLVRDVLI